MVSVGNDRGESSGHARIDGTLESLVAEGNDLLEDESDPVDMHSAHERWMSRAREWLAERAPNSGLSAQWCAFGPSLLVREGGYHDDPHSWQAFRMLVRSRLGWLAEHGPRVQVGTSRIPSLWALLHPEVRKLASPRFQAGHYADAVEAALKGLNSAVKARAQIAAAKEQDGASLMTTVFSVKNPLLVLDDLTTLSGQSIQQGYMQIFAGTMTGIRNPKAHDNITITAERAIHLLFLASLLWFKLEEARPAQ